MSVGRLIPTKRYEHLPESLPEDMLPYIKTMVGFTEFITLVRTPSKIEKPRQRLVPGYTGPWLLSDSEIVDEFNALIKKLKTGKYILDGFIDIGRKHFFAYLPIDHLNTFPIVNVNPTGENRLIEINMYDEDGTSAKHLGWVREYIKTHHKEAFHNWVLPLAADISISISDDGKFAYLKANNGVFELSFPAIASNFIMKFPTRLE